MSSAFFGTMGLDTIKFPSTELHDELGGSGVYGAMASSMYCKTYLLSAVGSDFPKRFLNSLGKRGIDLSLLQFSKKPSFKWSVKYSGDLRQARTINREMNSFEDFDVSLLKGKLGDVKAVFASKNDPQDQLAIFRETKKTAIQIMETRSHWITNEREDLLKVLELTDVFMVHDDELKLLTGEGLALPEMIEMVMSYGPRVVILMRGEHGVVMYGRLGTMVVPSYPLAFAVDPTGAGDVFGGTLAGVLGCIGKLTPSSMKKALILAGTMSSFVVEDFGISPLLDLEVSQVLNRTKMFLNQLPTGLDMHFEVLKKKS